MERERVKKKSSDIWKIYLFLALFCFTTSREKRSKQKNHFNQRTKITFSLSLSLAYESTIFFSPRNFIFTANSRQMQ